MTLHPILKSYKENYDSVSYTHLDVYKRQVRACLKQVCVSSKNVPDTVYIGVPGEFTTVVLKDYQIAFDRARKIGENELNRLYDTCLLYTSSRRTSPACSTFPPTI